MKKKDLIVLALVVVVIVEAFSVVLKTVVKSVAHAGNAAFKITSDRTIETDTINLDEFNELSLDVGSVNTYIKAGDDYKLEYHVYSDKKPIIDEKNGRLSIKQPSNFKLFSLNLNNIFGGAEQYYKLTVPKNSGRIKLDLDAASGKIDIKEVDVDGRILITSGNLLLNKSSGEELELSATSGNIELKNVELDKLSLDITSGNLRVNDCTTDEIDAHMTSGSLNFDDLKFNKADFESTSGKINLGAIGNKDDYSYDLKAVSGDFRVDGRKVEKEYRAGDKKDKIIRADLTSGSMNITFEK